MAAASLPLPDGAYDSRNAISDVGLLMMANPERIRDNPQALSDVTESEHQNQNQNNFPPSTNQRQMPQTTMFYNNNTNTNISHSPNESQPIIADPDDDGLLVPAEGLLVGQQPAPGANAYMQQNAEFATDMGANHLLASLPDMPSFGNSDAQTFGNMPSVYAQNQNQNQNIDNDDDSPVMAQLTPSQSEITLSDGESVTQSQSENNTKMNRPGHHLDSESLSTSSVTESQFSRSSNTRTRSKSSKRQRHGKKPRRRREQTYAEYEDAIRNKVKRQEDMEKREMLLLFYEKKVHEHLQVPEKFFKDGIKSDLQEMRWWYYKLIRDTRINDAVSSMKHNIVQVSRVGLFVNNTIGNPLNLHLDKEFPAELANTLDTDLDRHLREHVKSKCGVGGPKPNPMRHIIQGLLDCGVNYHRNKVAMEESERKRENKHMQETNQPMPDAPPTTTWRGGQQQQPQSPMDAYHMMRDLAGVNHQPSYGRFHGLPISPQYNNNQGYPVAQRRPVAPPTFRQNKQPLRDVFRHMTPDMRRHPLPAHLRPPARPSSAMQQGQQRPQQQTRSELPLPPPPPQKQQQPPQKQQSSISLGSAARAQRVQSMESSQPHLSQPRPASHPRRLTNTSQSTQSQTHTQPPPRRPPASRPSTLKLPPPPPPTLGQKKRSLMDPLPVPSSNTPQKDNKSRQPPLPFRPFTGQNKNPYKRRPSPLQNITFPQGIDVRARRRPFERERNMNPSLRPALSGPLRRSSPLPLPQDSLAPFINQNRNQTQKTNPNPTVNEQNNIVNHLQRAAVRAGPQSGMATEWRKVQSQQMQREEEARAAAAQSLEMTIKNNNSSRSYDDLMNELTQAYEEDDDSETLHVDESSVSCVGVCMPAVETNDKMADALTLMEGFGSGTGSNNTIQNRPTLYDIDDILGEPENHSDGTTIKPPMTLEEVRRLKQRRKNGKDNNNNNGGQSPILSDSRTITLSHQTINKDGKGKNKRTASAAMTTRRRKRREVIVNPIFGEEEPSIHENEINNKKNKMSTPPPSPTHVRNGDDNMVQTQRRMRDGKINMGWSSAKKD